MSAVEIIFLTAAGLMFSAGLLIISINPWRTINQAHAISVSLSSAWLFSIFMAIHIGGTDEHEALLFWLKTCNAFAAFLPWSYALVKIAITEPGSLGQVIKRSWPWFFAGCLLATLVYTFLYIPGDATGEAQKSPIAYAIFVSSLALLCILILSDALKRMRSCTGVRLLEIKFFAINICLSTLIILASFTASRISGILVLRHIAPFVTIASFGITVWAICYHRVFDARQVFAALGRRLSTFVVLATCILIAHLYLSRVLAEIPSLLVGVVIGALIAEYWDRKVYRWLDLDATRILAAPRAQITEWAREEADAGRLITRFETFLRDWCQAESVTIHTVESPEPPSAFLGHSDYPQTFPLLHQNGYITAETLARLRPDARNCASAALLTNRNLGALVAVPRGSHAPSCLVAFGHKHSLRPYTYPDIQLLLELVEMMDNILTHGRVATHAAQIEKMESAAMMSRGLAHDLNNLATPVSTFLLHMENRVQSGTAEAEVLADAKHSVRVMQDYIRESLFFARRLVPDFRSTLPSDILHSVVKLTQARASARGVEVVLGPIEDLACVADGALLQRLLQNLVFNGIDATPRGGKVVISAAAIDSQQACFSVRDQGQGIPPSIMDRIFEPYFTTKDTGDEIRGLGLGLAICRKISDLHTGELKVAAAPEGGTIFSFTLPVRQGIPAGPHENRTPDNAAPVRVSSLSASSVQASRP